jgi:hypothetical protein
VFDPSMSRTSASAPHGVVTFEDEPRGDRFSDTWPLARNPTGPLARVSASPASGLVLTLGK